MYNDLKTLVSRLSMLYSFKTRQRPSYQTRSNAFLKSIKLWELLLICQVLFHQQHQVEDLCSVVGLLLCDLKHACSSSKVCSAWFTNLLKITRSLSLLGWPIRLIVLCSDKVVCCLSRKRNTQWLCGPLSTGPDFVTHDGWGIVNTRSLML